MIKEKPKVFLPYRAFLLIAAGSRRPEQAARTQAGPGSFPALAAGILPALAAGILPGRFISSECFRDPVALAAGDLAAVDSSALAAGILPGKEKAGSQFDQVNRLFLQIV